MSKRPYQHLPPLEHRPDGSPYRITPPQKRRASGLIRRECCNCEDGNCLALDDGDTCACPQMISFSVCCKWFRWAVLPLDRTLEAKIIALKKSHFLCIFTVMPDNAIFQHQSSPAM